jgi:hypothetical protein
LCPITPHKGHLPIRKAAGPKDRRCQIAASLAVGRDGVEVMKEQIARSL